MPTALVPPRKEVRVRSVPRQDDKVADTLKRELRTWQYLSPLVTIGNHWSPLVTTGTPATNRSQSSNPLIHDSIPMNSASEPQTEILARPIACAEPAPQRQTSTEVFGQC